MTGLTKVSEDLATLLKMRETLSDPTKWCQYARFDGDRMCLVGAYESAVGGGFIADAYPATAKLLGIPHRGGISDRIRAATFNDSHTHAEVLALIDQAISARVC